jgi:short subunit dehydrogenase-like uncharacterized protein
MAEDRDHDLVLYGATGFVGRLIAAYLAEHAPAGVRIALAGRTAARLEGVRQDIGGAALVWPTLVVDAADDAAVARLAASTRVLATTVGPYLRYGTGVARACAGAGTDYLDLTGETLFVRWCADELDPIARASGARLVNSCGFDSIPSDLGVFLVAERARADGAGELGQTTLVVESIRGGVSGGTIDSLRAQLEVTAIDRERRRLVADPYALSPDRANDPQGRDERDDHRVRDDPTFGWLAPFVMASYNTRIVRRSNALQNYAYGRGLRYEEVMGFGSGPRAGLTARAYTAGLGLFGLGMSKPAVRRLLDRVLPKPGQGPSPKAQHEGRFRLAVHATTTSGARCRATVAAQGDPGYAATALMFAEAALTLVVDRERLPAAAGVLTPAAALAHPLIDRLRAAGMTLRVTPA